MKNIFKTNNKSKIAIIANTKKKQWPLGDYIHILSFLPNIKFKKLDWYSTSDLFKFIKEVDFINSYNKLNTFNHKKYDHIINLCDNALNTKKTFFINNLFNPRLNEKQNTKSLLKNLSKIYKIKNYKF